MQLSMIGLGRLGAYVVPALWRGDLDVIGYNQDSSAALAEDCSMLATKRLADFVRKPDGHRVVPLTLPAPVRSTAASR